jgi:hypothetical protein
LTQNPDELELAAGVAHEQLQGAAFHFTDEASLREGLEKAFDYRGDVTLTLANASTLEGYLFDRHAEANLARCQIRLLRPDGTRATVPYSEIRSLAFSGRDTAAGKSWEAWVTKYLAKKAAGESNIGIEAESLD